MRITADVEVVKQEDVTARFDFKVVEAKDGYVVLEFQHDNGFLDRSTARKGDVLTFTYSAVLD